MSRIPGLRRYFRLPLSRETLARDIAEELEFHLEMRAADLEALGVGAAEARVQARREFGDVKDAREELERMGRGRLRRQRRADLGDVIGQNLHWSFRMLAREPGVSLAVMLALAAGVGVNAVMFSVTDHLLFRAPPGIEEPDEVGRVFFHATLEPIGTSRQPVATWPQHEHLRTSPALVGAGAFAASQTASYGVGREARPVQVVLATGSLFTTLGTQARQGRFFTDAEGREGHAVAVVSTPFWQRELGAGPIAGQRIRVGRRDYDVVGVAPPGFTGVYLEPVDVWLPLGTAALELGGEGWDTERMQWLQIVARRGPVPPSAAETALTLAAREVNWMMRADTASRVTLESVVPARGLQPGWSRGVVTGRIAVLLSVTSLVVLLIACANVANLLLARASRRRREMGVRLALGIGRTRLAAQLMTETLVLGLAAGAVALLFAGWSGTLLRRLLLPDVEWAGRPVLDARLLLFGAAIILAAVVLAGLAPAVHAVRADVLGALHQGARGGAPRSRLRSGLVMLQAALSVALLVGAGLFVLSLHNLRSTDVGFDPRNLAVVRWPAGSLEMDRAQRHALYDESAERLRRLPEVQSVAKAAVAPLSGSISVSVGDGEAQGDSGGGVQVNAVSPGYLAVVGTRLLRGRDFTRRETAEAEPVAIVSEALAARLWPGADPFGQCLRWDRALCARVVGMMQNPRPVGPDSSVGELFLVPLAQQPTLSGERMLVVRLRSSPGALQRVRDVLQTLRPSLAHVDVATYDDLFAPALRPWALGARLFTAFGLLALALATLGLYGIVAYDVAQRSHEMSVRVALGAGRAAIARLVLGDAGRLLVPGVAVGVVVVLLVAGRVQPLLVGVSAHDPRVLLTAAAVLLVAGLAAAALPARRAAGADPIRALKEE